MSRSRAISRRLATTIAGLAVAITACAPPAAPRSGAAVEATARPDIVALSDTAMRNAGVTVAAAEAVVTADEFVAPGRVALDDSRTARIGSLQEGLVLDVAAQVGDWVGAADILATMHGHALHDAWAGYRKAIAERRRAQQQAAYAADAHGRASRLYTDKAISLEDLQRAEVDGVASAQAVDIAEAEVTRSIEELEHVGVAVPADAGLVPVSPTREAIPVRSPIAGVVLERLVTPGTTVVPGAAMFVVSDLSAVWVLAEIDEAQLSRVAVGRPMSATVAAYPDDRFAGIVSYIGDTVNPETRRVVVRGVVANPDRRLKPEMLATVSFGETAARPVVVVPSSAVQSLDGAAAVFVETAAGRFAPRAIELGAATSGGAVGRGRIVVRTGLAVGERVVVDGSFAVKSELLKPAAPGE